jgi:hypothetical protein
MIRVTLDPFEAVLSPRDRLVDLHQQLKVEDGLAVALAPALRLPPAHPLRHGVDHVLAVAQHEELVVEVLRRPEQLEHRFELALVVGGVRPAAGAPARFVDVPGPAGRAGVAEGGAVGGSGDHEWGLSKMGPN